MMRKLLTVVAGLTTGILLNAQCPAYYPLTPGQTMEMTNYDKKGKEEGKVQTTALSVEGNTINLRSLIFDEKGEQTASSDFTVTCEADALRVDMKNFMPPGSSSQYEGMEGVTIEITGDQLMFPSTFTVGQQLPDGVMTMTVSMNGMQLMNNTVNITNRRVEAMEDVTTPLGTFTCYKISSDVETKIFTKIKSHSIEWVNMEKGLIKQESRNDKGDLQGSSLRTA